MRNDRIDAATSSLCFISRCKVPHYFLPVQYPKVGKKKEFYKPLSPKISFVTYKSPFSLPTNSETHPRRLRSHRLSPTMKAERCCSNANKSPTFAVKRRTFTTPVQCCFLAMRVGVSRHAETRLVQRHFGDKKFTADSRCRDQTLNSNCAHAPTRRQWESDRISTLANRVQYTRKRSIACPN